MTRSVVCPYCHRDAALVTGNEIYPHRPDLIDKLFWRCAPCGAYVGCHPRAGKNGKGGIGDGRVPLGRLANAELRRAKQRAHAAFDPMWRSGQVRRKAAYAWLAGELGLCAENCHIGMMDVDACRAVVAVVENQRRKSA